MAFGAVRNDRSVHLPSGNAKSEPWQGRLPPEFACDTCLGLGGNFKLRPFKMFLGLACKSQIR